MLRKTLEIVKVIVKQLAIAFFFACIFFLIINLFFRKDINLTFGILNKMSIIENNTAREVFFDSEKRMLKKSPTYGTVWAKIKIESVGIDLDVYQGDSLKLLKYAAGHFTGSYFPGERGTIVIAAHNTEGKFANLYKTNIGDNIVIESIYGKFTYEIISGEVVNAKELDTMSINHEEEKLMLYTCYPTGGAGYRTQRYVVYAKLVGEEY